MDRVMALRMESSLLSSDEGRRYTFVLFGKAVMVTVQEWNGEAWDEGTTFLNWSVDTDLAGQELSRMVNAREQLGATLLAPPVAVDFDDLPWEKGMLDLYPHEIAGWWSSLEERAQREQLPENDGGVFDAAGDFLLRNGKPV